MSTLIQNGIPIFTDIDGDPLEDGYIYIGQPGLNPLSNPLQAYWDAALTIPAGNDPTARTKGGAAAYNGVPSRLYVPTNYSIIIKDKKDQIVYTVLDANDYTTPTIYVDSVSALGTLTGTKDGQVIKVKGYYAGVPLDMPDYHTKPDSVKTPNGGSVIARPEGGNFEWPEIMDVYASWYGLGIEADDTGKFETLCNTHANVIMDINATIKSATITNSPLKIAGNKNNILSIDIIKFTGDKIVLKDMKIKVTDASVLASEYSVTNGCLGGLVFQGSNCVVDDCEIYRDNYEYSSGYQSTRLVYFGMTVDMGDFVSQAQAPTGHNNEIRNSSLHDSKDGVDFAGRKNKVLNCRLNNLSNPVRFNASCRDVVANDNIIVGNIDNYYSGADGILCSRTVIGFTATNNEISNNGEHGVYFQGQKAEITNNRVFGNFHNGLKFGSYDDFSYVYAGETLDTWVPGSAGVPGFQEVVGADGFGLKDVVIANNNIYDNGESLSTAYGVYVQPSSKNFKIENNILENNSIYWVYFQTTSRLEDHIDVSITNNRVYGSFSGTNSYIECGCHSNAHIKDNYVEGKIFTYAPNSTVPPRLSQTQINSRIENNECEFIDPTRTTELKVTGNTMKYLISTSSFSRLFLNSNTITESLQIDPRNIREMKNNEIEILTDNQLIYSASSPYSFPLKTIGNTFKGDLYTGSYFISASFSANIPVGGVFSNNKIECELCSRPLYIEGEYCNISDNVIFGKNQFDIAIDNYGDNMVISNNVSRYGQIQNRNDSGNIVTSNKVAGIVDTGTTNIIANNG